MDHVNNAVYADWIDEAVIAAGDPDATRRHPATDPARVRARRRAGRDAGGGGRGPTTAAGRSGWPTVGGAEILRARLEPGMPRQNDPEPQG